VGFVKGGPAAGFVSQARPAALALPLVRDRGIWYFPKYHRFFAKSATFGFLANCVPSAKYGTPLAMITPAQIRAARALLNWGQDRLSERSGVSITTIGNIETERTSPHRSSAAAIQRALEEAGVEFTPDGGVKPRS